MSGLPPNLPPDVSAAMAGMRALTTGAAFAFAVNAKLKNVWLNDKFELEKFIAEFSNGNPRLLVSVVSAHETSYIAIYYEQE